MKKIIPTEKIGKYVILEGIEHGNRFFTTYSGGDPTKGHTGETWYRLLGWADTCYEAQEKLGIPEVHRTKDRTL